MKKLFATLLAATMVAGTAVSAFAAVETSYTPADDGADYTLSNVVLDDKGKEIKATDNISGGDKLYYPILVSQGALDKDAYKKDKYYLANYNSEVEKVTARIKNVKNGKYLKDPKIVRKDVAGLYSSDITVSIAANDITAGNPAVSDGDAKAEVKGEFTVDFSGITNVTAATAGDKLELTIGTKTISVAADSLTGTPTAKDVAKLFEGDHTIDNVTYTATAATNVVTFKDKATVTKKYDVPTSATLKAIPVTTPSTGTIAIKGNVVAAKVNDGAPEIIANNGTAGHATTSAITGIKKNDKLTLTYGGTTATAIATADNKLDEIIKAYNDKKGAYSANLVDTNKIKFTQNTPAVDVPNTITLSKGYATKDNKVYCVEVVLGDYFGNEEKELEFDLELRNKGKLEYSTKDNNANDPLTYFNLGNDATELVAGKYIGAKGDETTKRGKVKKFRNGDLELEITADTDSVKLDEATLSDGKTVEDVENIYLEGKDISFTFDVKASGQDDLFLSVNKDSNKKVVQANEKADIEFVNFPGKPEFDFTGLFKYTVEDPDINYYFYEIVDDKPVKTSAKYNKEDECFELRTRTLGSYAISDKELEAAENPADKDADKPATDKPTTETPVNPTTPGKNVPTGALA